MEFILDIDTSIGWVGILSKGEGILIIAIGYPKRSRLLKECELVGRFGIFYARYIP